MVVQYYTLQILLCDLKFLKVTSVANSEIQKYSLGRIVLTAGLSVAGGIDANCSAPTTKGILILLADGGIIGYGANPVKYLIH